MKGILFNEHFGLESAVLNGSKTQTRRIAKVLTDAQFVGWKTEGVKEGEYYDTAVFQHNEKLIYAKSKYKVGEIVAIKQNYETFVKQYDWDSVDSLQGLAGWKNKMFTRNDLMPHKIKITNIRVERLQDVSDEDCLKEGMVKCNDPLGICGYHWYVDSNLQYSHPKQAFAALIDKVSVKGTWESNPYVFVYDFELIRD